MQTSVSDRGEIRIWKSAHFEKDGFQHIGLLWDHEVLLQADGHSQLPLISVETEGT